MYYRDAGQPPGGPHEGDQRVAIVLEFVVSHAERETGGGPDEMQAGSSTLPNRMIGFHLPLDGTNCAFYATSGQKFIGPKASA